MKNKVVRINIALLAGAVTICAAVFAATSHGVKAAVTEQTGVVEEYHATEEDMNEIASVLDEDLIMEVSEALGSATTDEYIQAFMEADPESAEMIKNILEEDE